MESALTILGLLTITIWAAASATGPYIEARFQMTNNNDVTEGVDALFESAAYSRSSCAMLCVARHDCHGLKFVPGVSATSPGQCFGYTVDKECRSSHRRSRRVTSTWLERPCQDVADCPGTQTRCHLGKCLCQTSTYYSIGGDNCVTACPRSQLDMGGAYLKYNKTDTVPVITEYIEPSLCQCMAECVNHASDCRAVVFNPITGLSSTGNNCYLIGHFTNNDAPSWYAWTLYKRNCA